ncbi:MAG: radical SAM protein [Calditrichaeota bacterium]|nr:MAG: radical SAM protein [Calditrichota bacterium]
MKILISHSYYLHRDPKEAANRRPYPPLAPLTLIGWLRQELGLDAQFYDVMFDRDVAGLARAIERMQPEVFILYDDDFNFLTKMCLENMRRAVFEVLRRAPKTGLFIAHGSDASDQAEQYLRAGFDFVAHRNAELTVVELLRRYRQHRSPEPLKPLNGISFLEQGRFVQKPQIKTNLPLEKAPRPAWDKIDLRPYRSMWRKSQGYFSLNISTSHGCPYGCNWCAKPLYGRTYQAMPPERAAAEFYYLVTELQAEHLWVTDDIFALKPGWITRFADELERLGVKVPYKCQNRADLITEEMAAELARSGCAEVWLGVESGSQKILDAMNKGETVETIKAANRRLQRHGIQVGFFLQYGYLGEDYEDIRLTLRLLRECLPDHIGISVSYPLKDTPFYEAVAAQMKEKHNWTDSGDLALMYRGTYPPDFYRALHRYTHHYFGFISLFKPQPLTRRLRRLAAQYRHIPGMIKYRRRMRKCLRLAGA